MCYIINHVLYINFGKFILFRFLKKRKNIKRDLISFFLNLSILTVITTHKTSLHAFQNPLQKHFKETENLALLVTIS